MGAMSRPGASQSIPRSRGRAVSAAAFALVALLVAGGARSHAAPVGRLTVELSKLRSDAGQAGCALYDSDKGFPTEPQRALQRIFCPIAQGAARCAFEPVPAGTYAVACFHDQNGNGVLDLGRLGIPVEGTVVSNHARGFLGPPRWSGARFEWSGQDSRMALRMSY